MSQPVTANTLNYAARTQRGFGYLVGLVGSATGAVFLVQGQTLVVAAVWAATFVLGALFVGLGMVLAGLAEVVARNNDSNAAPDNAARFA